MAKAGKHEAANVAVVEIKAPEVKPSGYETLDGNEAAEYQSVGGRIVSITRRYPDNPYKPGKRYLFLQTKAELDSLKLKKETV